MYGYYPLRLLSFRRTGQAEGGMEWIGMWWWYRRKSGYEASRAQPPRGRYYYSCQSCNVKGNNAVATLFPRLLPESQN